MKKKITCFALILLFILIYTQNVNQRMKQIKVRHESKNKSQKLRTVDWLIHRKDQHLSGFVNLDIPDSLKLLWTYKTGKMIDSSPIIKGEQVFVTSKDQNLYCLNSRNGRVNWSFQADSSLVSSPLFVNDLIIVGSFKGIVYAVKSDDGQFFWRTEVGERIQGGFNLVEGPVEKMVVFGSYDHHLYALSLNDGSKQWSFETDHFINGVPCVFKNEVIVGGCDAKIYRFQGDSGTLIETIDAKSYVAGSPSVREGICYFGNYEGELFAYDLINKKMLWMYKDQSTGPFASTPALNEQQLLIGSRDYQMYCLDNLTGEKQWSYQTQGKIDCSPIICKDHVVFGSNDGWIYILSCLNGELKWKYEIGTPLNHGFVFNGKYLIVTSQDGYVFCFGENR